MGARIAAHFANARIPSLLLDMAAPGAGDEARNHLARAGIDAAKKAKPAALFDPALAALITAGNFDDNLGEIGGVDWVLEAIVENLEIKRALLARVDQFRKPGTIITTNTSGLRVEEIARGFPEDFRRSWFGTHFFNPPRYMRLLEVIPTAESDPKLVEMVRSFSDLELGKGVVVAKDTPNFIANRIGTFSVLNVMRLMQELELTVEEVDALTGSAIGWPRSATFRTLDMVGLDVVGHVVHNLAASRSMDAASANPGRTPDESSELALPRFFEEMLERKMLGDKSGGGFYRKAKGAGEGEQLVLDWKTLEYRPRQKPQLAQLEMAKNIDDLGLRLRTLITGPAQAKPAQFLWSALSDLWTYSANRIPEIADDLVSIDRAMRLGFNWELGPFELWDAAGVETSVERMRREHRRLAPKVDQLLATGKKSWYLDDPQTASGRLYFDFPSHQHQPVVWDAGIGSVEAAKKAGGVVKKNSGASLVDGGDGVGILEFHSKMNSLGGDIVDLIRQSLKPEGIGKDFEAFVIANDAPNFSVGANLMLLLMSAQDGEWEEIDLAVRSFQAMTQAIKFSSRPVVIAPCGLTLGGGCEIALHGALRNPHAELYMGLVEVGVGLLPAGGGSKEMLVRAVQRAQAIRPEPGRDSIELLEEVKRAFETVALAKVSSSAEEARSLGFLDSSDRVTMNRERVLFEAKQRALELVSRRYRPPQPRTDLPAPGENILAALKLGIHLMRQGEYISDHEVKIATKVAEVLCGGDLTPGSAVSEQYVLDLEREAFKSLCGEKKTQERMQYTLKTGKTLRN